VLIASVSREQSAPEIAAHDCWWPPRKYRNTTVSGYRTVFELAAKRIPGSQAIRTLLLSQHNSTRGSDYDPFIVGYNALTGR
jgi:hypothetical protein